MPRSESREPGTRRSRSRRSRTRHRSHHHHRSRTRLRIKYKEKNFLAAVCSMITIVILSTALAEPKWISLKGGGCEVTGGQRNHLGTAQFLGTNQFFYPGHFPSREVSFGDDAVEHEIYQYGPGIDDKMDNCVTYKAVLLFKTIISFCFLGILCSLAAFILDLLGPKSRGLKLLRRNAILSIVTVIICVVINLFCYWITTEVDALQKRSKTHTGSKVSVDFDISFYLVTVAGCVALLATAFNCLRRYPMYEDSQGESLLDDYDGMDPVSALGPDMSQLASLPPPPEYTP